MNTAEISTETLIKTECLMRARAGVIEYLSNGVTRTGVAEEIDEQNPEKNKDIVRQICTIRNCRWSWMSEEQLGLT